MIGIIGCGAISRFHLTGYELAGANIAHVCDIRPDIAAAVAKKYHAKASTDYQAVIDDPDVQLVSVLTNASYHKEICLAAIKAGKGVVCEKTLSDNPADSYEIAQAAAAAGVFCATAYMKRYFPAIQLAKKLLADMGEIISIHARSWQPWDLWTTHLSDELLQHPSTIKQRYGGGVLVCGGSHILDLIHWFGGRPSQVCGDLHVRDGMDIDNRANAMLWLENGGIVSFEACWHPLAYAGYERNGWDERLEINTVQSRLEIYTVTWDMPERNGALLIHQDAKTGHVTEYRYPAMNPFHAEMAEMLRCFSAKTAPMPSAIDGYVVDEIIAHITKSSEQQQKIPLLWRDRNTA